MTINREMETITEACQYSGRCLDNPPPVVWLAAELVAYSFRLIFHQRVLSLQLYRDHWPQLNRLRPRPLRGFAKHLSDRDIFY